MSCAMAHTQMIVPTLCVGMPPRTLRVLTSAHGDAERHTLHSHAERGNDQARA